MSLTDEKYKKVKSESTVFENLLKDQPLLSLIFAAAGFYYDHGWIVKYGSWLGYFVFTSDERTRKVIEILRKHQGVGVLFHSYSRKQHTWNIHHFQIHLKYLNQFESIVVVFAA